MHERRGDGGAGRLRREVQDHVLGALDGPAGQVAAAEGGEEQVLVAPEHSLRPPGRAPGVEQELVVARARHRRSGAGRAGQQLPRRPVPRSTTSAPSVAACSVVGQLGLAHDERRFGVGHHRPQLVDDVVAVDVDGDRPDLEGAEHRLEVGRAGPPAPAPPGRPSPMPRAARPCASWFARRSSSAKVSRRPSPTTAGRSATASHTASNRSARLNSIPARKLASPFTVWRTAQRRRSMPGRPARRR